MDNSLATGFLGDDPNLALEQLKNAFDNHVVPFIKDWWEKSSPIPSDSEIESIKREVLSRATQGELPDPYCQLPQLLSNLAEGFRFNRLNFVNIHPSPFLPSVLASFVTSIQNPNNIVEEVSKATTMMEMEAIQWMAENLFGITNRADSKAWGNIVSGGTIANMTALLVARDYTYDKLSRPRNARIGPRGVIGCKPGVVLGTAASHYSIEKALWFLGLGHENLIRVPVCWDESMKREQFKERRFIAGIQKPHWKSKLVDAIRDDEILGNRELTAFYEGEQSPFGLQPLNSEILKTLYSCFEFDTPLIGCVLTLGTTDTGTIERINGSAIEELRREDIFIHVDAASGGFAFLDTEVQKMLGSMEHVDSFTVDPHKMGFLHYPCGAVLFRDEGFRQQIYHEAPYLGPLAPTLEGSRPGSGAAALWLAQKTIGKEGYQWAVGHLLGFTSALQQALANSGKFQVLHKVDLPYRRRMIPLSISKRSE
jgi:glutamate/tyrosine decarboxylase-like PLP-dependent enzyme